MTTSLPALQAVGPLIQNFVAQAKAFPQSLKNKQMAKKIEDNAFNVLLAVGALACSRSYKTPFAVGAALGAVVQIKHKEIMNGIAPLAQKYLPLGDKQLGLLSLFMQKAESEKDPFNKGAINSMLALMVVYLVSPWLGSKITAAAFGFIAVKQLYQLKQKNPAPTDEVESPDFQPVASVARKIDFNQTGFGNTSDPQGDSEQ